MITNCGLGVVTDKVLPDRRDSDFYPTDSGTVRSVLRDISCNLNPRDILDPGAGGGVWGTVARGVWPKSRITGMEIRDVPKPEDYDGWICPVDFLTKPVYPGGYDLVMGNPPYAHAESFVRKGLEYLRPGGVLVYLLRLAFLEGQRRRDGLFADYPPELVYVCSKRPSFSGDGKTNATAFGCFVWSEGWTGRTSLHWLR